MGVFGAGALVTKGSSCILWIWYRLLSDSYKLNLKGKPVLIPAVHPCYGQFEDPVGYLTEVWGCHLKPLFKGTVQFGIEVIPLLCEII